MTIIKFECKSDSLLGRVKTRNDGVADHGLTPQSCQFFFSCWSSRGILIAIRLTVPWLWRTVSMGNIGFSGKTINKAGAHKGIMKMDFLRSAQWSALAVSSSLTHFANLLILLIFQLQTVERASRSSLDPLDAIARLDDVFVVAVCWSCHLWPVIYRRSTLFRVGLRFLMHSDEVVC